MAKRYKKDCTKIPKRMIDCITDLWKGTTEWHQRLHSNKEEEDLNKGHGIWSRY